MPHVIINGAMTPEDIYLAFEPTEFVEDGKRYKAEEAFISSDRNLVLIRSLTVDRGFKKAFYVRIHHREDDAGITLGLDPLNRPEVNDPVKRLIGLYAWKILQVEPEVQIESSNIKEFLGDPKV